MHLSDQSTRAGDSMGDPLPRVRTSLSPHTSRATDSVLMGVAGFCAKTDVFEGVHCSETDVKGSWTESSLAHCVAQCEACTRCHFVSFSPTDNDCSWFASCPKLGSGGDLTNYVGAHATWQVRHPDGSWTRFRERLRLGRSDDPFEVLWGKHVVGHLRGSWIASAGQERHDAARELRAMEPFCARQVNQSWRRSRLDALSVEVDPPNRAWSAIDGRALSVFDGAKSTCEAHCDQPCDKLDGDLHIECGGCGARVACHPGAPRFPTGDVYPRENTARTRREHSESSHQAKAQAEVPVEAQAKAQAMVWPRKAEWLRADGSKMSRRMLSGRTRDRLGGGAHGVVAASSDGRAQLAIGVLTQLNRCAGRQYNQKIGSEQRVAVHCHAEILMMWQAVALAAHIASGDPLRAAPSG